MEEKTQIFDQLLDAMGIDVSGGKKGLRNTKAPYTNCYHVGKSVVVLL